MAAPAPNPNSPLSEGNVNPNAFEFSKITTGAKSISSTDSEMAKHIAAMNGAQGLDSPPNLISPKAGTIPILNVIDQMDPNQQLADEMANMIIGSMLEELREEIPILVARPELMRP